MFWHILLNTINKYLLDYNSLYQKLTIVEKRKNDKNYEDHLNKIYLNL